MAQTLLEKYSTYEEEALGIETLTANSTGTQASGTLVTKKHVNVSVCAGAGYSTTFSFAALPGAECYYVNNGANSNNLYPKVGDKFESQAVDAAYAVGVGEYWHFKCIVAGTWRIK